MQLHCRIHVVTTQFVESRAVSHKFWRALEPGSQLGAWGLNDHRAGAWSVSGYSDPVFRGVCLLPTLELHA